MNKLRNFWNLHKKIEVLISIQVDFLIQTVYVSLKIFIMLRFFEKKAYSVCNSKISFIGDQNALSLN